MPTNAERPYAELLQGIISTYQKQKTFWSPTDSAVIVSLRELTIGLKNATLSEEQLYFQLLKRSIYFAQIPPEKKAVHEQERLTFDSLPVKKLEDKFLNYHKNNYFSSATHAALVNLRTVISVKHAAELESTKRAAELESKHAEELESNKRAAELESNKRAAELESNKRERRSSVSMAPEISRVGSVGAPPSLAPTCQSVCESVLLEYAAALNTKTVLSAKEEYLLFRENYSILIMLKKRNPILTDSQVELYKRILLFPAAKEATSLDPAALAVTDEEIFRVFEFDAAVQKKVARSRQQLNKAFPNLLTQELALEQEEKVAVIKRMIECRNDNSILLPDERLNTILQLPLFLPAVSEATPEPEPEEAECKLPPKLSPKRSPSKESAKGGLFDHHRQNSALSASREQSAPPAGREQPKIGQSKPTGCSIS